MKPAKPEQEESSANKGIDMLRLDRKLAKILDKWREAKKADPKAWGLTS